MDTVILCGGLGKRLRNEIGESQKVMAEVDGQPFLEILLDCLKRQDFKRAVLCTGYKSESIEEYYKDKDFGLELVYSKEAEPLGTGGALKNARDLVTSDTFFVLNGDSFCPVHLADMLTFHKNKEAVATIALSEVEEQKDFGSIVIDEDNKITSFLEKVSQPKTEETAGPLVNAGIYCFERKIFDLMPEEKVFSMEKDVFPGLVGQGLFGFDSGREFIDIGTPERYAQAKHWLKDMG